MDRDFGSHFLCFSDGVIELMIKYWSSIRFWYTLLICEVGEENSLVPLLERYINLLPVENLDFTICFLLVPLIFFSGCQFFI